jgi:hypothetical protein
MKRKEREDKRAKHDVDFFTPSKKATQQVTQKKSAEANFNATCTTYLGTLLKGSHVGFERLMPS